MDGTFTLLRRCSIAAVTVATMAVLGLPALASAEPLSPYTTVSGEHLALSIDGLGTNNPAGGPIRVEKSNAGETVRAAYLFAATTGGSEYAPENGDVTLNGNGLEWEPTHTIPTTPGVGAYNAVANVTSIVAPIVDAAPTGLVDLTVAEGEKTYSYDGEILAVILEDPAVNEARSLTLLYGAQEATGDTFHVGLAEPIDLAEPGFALNLSLGISYGYQPAGQYSIVEVNGKLMTSSAGGQDDCEEKYSATPDWAACGNGELLTVGGIGDTTEDPPNPQATDETCENAAGEGAPRCDDELYSLLPFVATGESTISFFTDNPSDNDNIFFGALEVHGGAAVIGEGVTLSPVSGTNTVGESHTVTASVQNATGEAIEGAKVHFQVVSGPNEGLSAEASTSSTGKALFTYSSSSAGVDHIVASYTNSAETKFESNAVSEAWTTAAATTTPAASSGTLAFTAKETTKACTSKRDFQIHIQHARDLGIASAVVSINGHARKTLTGKHLYTAIDLAGLPKGTFTVEIVAHLRDGRTVHGKRVYHTCLTTPLPGASYLPL
jgi:hypothetical protein